MSCGLIKVLRLNGRVPYPETLILQQNLVNKKLLNRQSEPDYLIISEHEPCITLGRRCHSDYDLINSSYPIFKSPRGGKVTFHGPGQITCYPILDLKRQPKLSLEFYVQNLAKVMKDSLSKSFNLNDLYYDKEPERVGLWLPSNKKIGFIGIQAQKWITSHGFSINLRRDSLKGFNEIDPCGLLNQKIAVTCVEDNIDIIDKGHNVTENIEHCMIMDKPRFIDEIIKSFTNTFNLTIT